MIIKNNNCSISFRVFTCFHDLIESFYFQNIRTNFVKYLAHYCLDVHWLGINIFYQNKQVAFVTYASQYLSSHNLIACKLTCDTLHPKTSSTFFFYFVYCHCHSWESSSYTGILKYLIWNNCLNYIWTQTD